MGTGGLRMNSIDGDRYTVTVVAYGVKDRIIGKVSDVGSSLIEVTNRCNMRNAVERKRNADKKARKAL